MHRITNGPIALTRGGCYEGYLQDLAPAPMKAYMAGISTWSRPAVLRCTPVAYFGPISSLRGASFDRPIAARAIRSRFFEAPIRHSGLALENKGKPTGRYAGRPLGSELRVVVAAGPYFAAISFVHPYSSECARGHLRDFARRSNTIGHHRGNMRSNAAATNADRA